MQPVVEEPNEIREWLQAGATIAAVMVALGIAFYGRWREWRRQPKLRLFFDPDPNSASLDLVTIGTNPPSHWARVRVENSAGRRSADRVEVLVTRFRLIGEVGFSQPPLDTRPLRWSNTWVAQATEANIPPGVSRHCNLLALEAPDFVLKTDHGGGAVADELAMRDAFATAVLQTDPEPEDQRHRLTEGTYELELAITALDVDARFYWTTITFDGMWREGPDVWQGIRIESFGEGRLI